MKRQGWGWNVGLLSLHAHGYGTVGASRDLYLEIICIVLFSVFVLYFSYVTVEPGYNDTGLRDTSSITSDILLYQSIPHC
jgi:hypothetical protein